MNLTKCTHLRDHQPFELALTVSQAYNPPVYIPGKRMNELKTKIRRETKRHVAKHRNCIVISVSCTTDTKDYFYNIKLDTEPYLKHS